jgi:hypothetical protein
MTEENDGPRKQPVPTTRCSSQIPRPQCLQREHLKANISTINKQLSCTVQCEMCLSEEYVPCLCTVWICNSQKGN